MSVLHSLWNYAARFQRQAIIAAIYSILNKFFDVLPEVLIGVAIDIVVSREQSFLAKLGISSPLQQLAYLALVTFVIWLLESLTEYGALVRWRNLAQQLQHALRMDGVKHIQKLSLSWYEKQNSGRLLTILNDDVNQVERFLNEGSHKFIQLFVSSLLVSTVFFYLSPMIAAFALLPIPLIIWGGFRFRSQLAGKYASVREAASLLAARLSGIITGVVTIRSSVAEAEQVALVEASSQQYIEANRSAIALSSAFVPIIRMSVLAGFLFTLVLGGRETLAGHLSPAAYTVLVFLTQRLLWPFTAFGELLDLYERSMASAKRSLGLMEAPLGIVDAPQTVKLETIKGQISFQNLDFAYPDGQLQLQNFQLEVKAGEFIGIVGPTGAGKSTLIKLLLRFYDPTRGRICLDGIPLTDLAQHELRRSIGYVGQEVFLMDSSIRQNLTMGKPSASEADIYQALEAASAMEFIKNLPQGIDTLIGERGQRLSGGQRQRLTIARALLGKPKILIFDEATSAVDNETEVMIQQSIQALAKNRSLLVVAHRLSTIREADRIVVLKEGKIQEIGSHAELVRAGGLYARLLSRQEV